MTGNPRQLLHMFSLVALDLCCSNDDPAKQTRQRSNKQGSFNVCWQRPPKIRFPLSLSCRGIEYRSIAFIMPIITANNLASHASTNHYLEGAIRIRGFETQQKEEHPLGRGKAPQKHPVGRVFPVTRVAFQVGSRQ